MKPLFDLSLEPQASITTELKNELWDFVIIGAGPAGALAAYLLAPKTRVLLIDQAAFPREKTCGGCLSQGALQELERAGLRSLVAGLEGKPIESLYIASGGSSTKISIPRGLSLSRKKMDFALIEAAKLKGTVFLPSTKGVLNPAKNDSVRISLTQGQHEFTVRAKTALICDGLNGSSLQHFSGLNAQIAPDSLVGVSTSCDSSGFAEQSSAISMACGAQGYVGMATREDNKLEIAAAVKPVELKAAGSPSVLVEKILSEAGFKVPAGLAKAKWLGAPGLLRQRSILSGERFFVLGDAAGFVEPFTGEGMYWALLQANELVTLLENHNYTWSDQLRELWQIKNRQTLGRRQRLCRCITWVLRIPWLCRALILILNRYPPLGSKLARIIHGGTA